MKRIVFFLVVAFVASSVVAQECYNVKRQPAVVLPGTTCNLSVVDGKLLYYASGLLLSSPVANGVAYATEGDTSYMHYDEDMNYVVRQPRTNQIYYTAVKRGHSHLYTLEYRQGKSPKLRKVRLSGARYGICHPSFSGDGRYMVFSMPLPEGRSVLMYSYQNNDGEWSTAMQLSSYFSMAYSEMAPVIHQDFVYFSACDTVGHWHLCAARLLKPIIVDSFNVEPALGRASTMVLPAPFASDGDNYEMALDTVNGRVFILSSRSGCLALYLYNNALPVVSLVGKVVDIAEMPLGDVSVAIFDGDQLLCRTHTDDKGMYQLLLPATSTLSSIYGSAPAKHYTLWLSKDGYFGNTVDFNAVQFDENHAVSYYETTTRLDQLDLASTLYISDVFGSEANVELTAIGKQKLQRVIRFLYDNPQISMEVSLSSAVTDDAEFNTMITDRRLEMLRRFFEVQLPSNKVIYINAHHNAKSATSGRYNSRLAFVFK